MTELGGIRGSSLYAGWVDMAGSGRDPTTPPGLVPRSEVVRRLRMTPTTFRRNIEGKLLSPVRIDGAVFFREEDVERLGYGMRQAADDLSSATSQDSNVRIAEEQPAVQKSTESSYGSAAPRQAPPRVAQNHLPPVALPPSPRHVTEPARVPAALEPDRSKFFAVDGEPTGELYAAAFCLLEKGKSTVDLVKELKILPEVAELLAEGWQNTRDHCGGDPVAVLELIRSKLGESCPADDARVCISILLDRYRWFEKSLFHQMVLVYRLRELDGTHVLVEKEYVARLRRHGIPCETLCTMDQRAQRSLGQDPFESREYEEERNFIFEEERTHFASQEAFYGNSWIEGDDKDD